MEVFLILDFPLKIPCLARFLFWIYHRKWSWPIRLQDSWKFNISTKMRDQGNFLFTDKHQSFLQVGAIPFGRWGQLFPKYPKWQVCNIFVIFQERREGRTNVIFLHEDKHHNFLQAGTIVFTDHDKACAKYPK